MTPPTVLAGPQYSSQTFDIYHRYQEDEHDFQLVGIQFSAKKYTY